MDEKILWGHLIETFLFFIAFMMIGTIFSVITIMYLNPVSGLILFFMVSGVSFFEIIRGNRPYSEVRQHAKADKGGL